MSDKQIAASQSIVTATDHLIAELESCGCAQTAHGPASPKTSSCPAFHEPAMSSTDHVHDEATSLPTGSAGPMPPLSSTGDRLRAEQLGHRLDNDRTTNGAGGSALLHCGSA